MKELSKIGKEFFYKNTDKGVMNNLAIIYSPDFFRFATIGKTMKKYIKY